MNPKATACLSAFAIFAIFVYGRRRIFDLTCTGVFFVSYVIFVGLGVLASPWLMEGYLQESFSYLRWSYITPRDLNVAIASITVGMLAVLSGTYAADTVHTRGSARWLELLRGTRRVPLGTRANVLFIGYCGLAGTAGLMLATKLPAVISGFVNAYVHLDHEAYYRARETVQQLGLSYYLIIYNALPFCAQALFFAGRLRPMKSDRRAAFIWLALPVLFLVLTFEKTALVLFLLLSGVTLMLTRLHTRRGSMPVADRFSIQQFWRTLRRMRRFLWLPLCAAISILALFYTLTTDSITNQVSALAVAGKALAVVADRICLRLAVMPIMYAHYFPQIEPCYGFANVGKLAFLTGTEYFPDTQKVLYFFTGLEEGGGAIGSLTDFFSAFGWPGLLIGGFGLGTALRMIDRWLRRLPLTVINRVLWLYLLYVSWYLSQASMFRCLSSYGAGVFVTLWFIFSVASHRSPRLPFSASS